ASSMIEVGWALPTVAGLSSVGSAHPTRLHSPRRGLEVAIHLVSQFCQVREVVPVPPHAASGPEQSIPIPRQFHPPLGTNLQAEPDGIFDVLDRLFLRAALADTSGERRVLGDPGAVFVTIEGDSELHRSSSSPLACAWNRPRS